MKRLRKRTIRAARGAANLDSGGRPLLLAALTLALLASGTPAWANSGETISLTVDPIHVASDGESYVSVAPFEWDAQINIDAGSVGKIKNYTYWVELEVEGMPTNLSLEPWAASKSWGVGSRPDNITLNIGNLVSSTTSPSGWYSVETFAKAVCNNNKAGWQAKGYTNEQIFSQQHKIAVRAIDKWDVDFTVDNYLDLIVEGSYWFTEIVCDPAGKIGELHKEPPMPPEPASRNFAVPFQISAASISVDPAKAKGPCPMDLDVTAALTAVGEGTASFRLLHNGAPGPVRKVTFGKGGTKKDTAKFEVGAPASGPAFEANSGSGGGGGGGATMVAPSNPNQHSGSFAIQVVEPNPLESEEAYYSVDCVSPTMPPATTSLAGRRAPTHEPGPPEVELSPWRRDTCRGLHLEVAPGDGAPPERYEMEWQQRTAGVQRWVHLVTIVDDIDNTAEGPALDMRVPRREPDAGELRIRVRSGHPRGPWSGWRVVRLEPCRGAAHRDQGQRGDRGDDGHERR